MHTDEAVDLSYARDGLPLLLNHDRYSAEAQVGLLEQVRVEEQRLVAELRFGSSPLAQQIRQDVLDGIRRNMSIGYRVDQLVEEPVPGAERDPDTGLVPTQFRVLRWTPMEGSLVPVPADITVGVERQDDRETFPVAVTLAAKRADPAQERTMALKTEAPGAEGAAPAAAPTTIPARVTDPVDHATRAADVTEIATHYGHGARAAGWIREGLDVEQVKGKIFDLQVKAATAARPTGHVDLTEQETRQYSICEAIRLRASDEWNRQGCLAREVSDTIRDRMVKVTGMAPSARGFYVPTNLRVPGELHGLDQLRRGGPQILNRAAITGQVVGTDSLGGFAVATQLMPLIELLRNRMMTRALGATVLTGLSSNLAFPRQITANTLSWTGENPTAANANTTLTLNQLTLSPKTAMVSTAISRQVLIQSSPDMDALVMGDLALVFALGFDLAGLAGTGSNNQPTGIFNTSGVNVRALGTAGALMDWANLVGLETDIATQNADVGNLGYMTNPAQRGKLKTTLKTTVSGASFLWDPDSTINGYQAAATQQVPSNFTKGTATTICSGYLFGNWRELIYGEFGGAVELIVDPYTAAGQNMIQVHGIGCLDVGVRHTQSFSVVKDAL